MVLFSLAPCSVKESLLKTVDLSYTKPLNKSKSTFQFSRQCQNPTILEHSTSSNVKATLELKLICGDPVGNLYSNYFVIKKTGNNYSGIITGNSPPKYILFKRLKVDLVYIS